MTGIARIGMIMAGALGMMAPAVAPQQPRRVGRRHHSTVYGGGRSRTTTHATNGDRECDRRKRQIVAGSLRVENGLVPS